VSKRLEIIIGLNFEFFFDGEQEPAVVKVAYIENEEAYLWLLGKVTSEMNQVNESEIDDVYLLKGYLIAFFNSSLFLQRQETI